MPPGSPGPGDFSLSGRVRQVRRLNDIKYPEVTHQILDKATLFAITAMARV
jgi:hypothetical protein